MRVECGGGFGLCGGGRTQASLLLLIIVVWRWKHVLAKGEEASLNGFLKEQRILLKKISSGELHANAQIVLSGPSNS